jgi:hypothetical protein
MRLNGSSVPQILVAHEIVGIW